MGLFSEALSEARAFARWEKIPGNNEFGGVPGGTPGPGGGGGGGAPGGGLQPGDIVQTYPDGTAMIFTGQYDAYGDPVFDFIDISAPTGGGGSANAPTSYGGTYIVDLGGGYQAIMQDTNYGPQVIEVIDPKSSPSYYGGQVPKGYQPVYDNAGNIVDYYELPKEPSYYGGQTPKGYQPVYDSKGNIVDYYEMPSTATGLEDVGYGMLGTTQEGGGYGQFIQNPNFLTDYDKRTLDRLDAELGHRIEQDKADLEFMYAELKSLEFRAGQDAAVRREQIAADIANTQARINADLQIAGMQDATQRYVAHLNASVDMRGQDVQQRGQDIGFITDIRGQDVQREGTIMGAYGDYLNYAGQADPFRSAILLTGGSGGTTPFEYGADAFRTFLGARAATLPDFSEPPALPPRVAGLQMAGGGGGGGLVVGARPAGSTAPRQQAPAAAAVGGVPVFGGKFLQLPNGQMIKAARGLRVRDMRAYDRPSNITTLTPDQIRRRSGETINILTGDAENPNMQTGYEELIRAEATPEGDLRLREIVPNDELYGVQPIDNAVVEPRDTRYDATDRPVGRSVPGGNVGGSGVGGDAPAGYVPLPPHAPAAGGRVRVGNAAAAAPAPYVPVLRPRRPAQPYDPASYGADARRAHGGLRIDYRAAEGMTFTPGQAVINPGDASQIGNLINALMWLKQYLPPAAVTRLDSAIKDVQRQQAGLPMLNPQNVMAMADAYNQKVNADTGGGTAAPAPEETPHGVVQGAGTQADPFIYNSVGGTPPMGAGWYRNLGGQVLYYDGLKWSQTGPTAASASAPANVYKTAPRATAGVIGTPRNAPYYDPRQGVVVKSEDDPRNTPATNYSGTNGGTTTPPATTPGATTPEDDALLRFGGLLPGGSAADVDAARATVADMLRKLTTGAATPSYDLDLEPLYGVDIGNPQDYAYLYDKYDPTNQGLLRSAFDVRGIQSEDFLKRMRAFRPAALQGGVPVAYG